MNRAAIRTIYLAGPEVFLPNARALGERKKQICAKYGFEGHFPLDNELSLDGLAPREAGLLIGRMNQDLIRRCDAVVANVTPFRGPSADVGTVWEMGFAAGLGHSVSAYSNTVAPFFDRTVTFSGRTTVDADGTVRDSLCQAIENFALAANLMIESCIEKTGGVFVAREAPAGHELDSLEAFEECVRLLRAQGSQP